MLLLWCSLYFTQKSSIICLGCCEAFHAETINVYFSGGFYFIVTMCETCRKVTCLILEIIAHLDCYKTGRSKGQVITSPFVEDLDGLQLAFVSFVDSHLMALI